MTGRPWTVKGVGDYSEIYSEELKTWVRASKRVVRPGGQVVASGRTATGNRVSFTMEPGEVWTVR